MLLGRTRQHLKLELLTRIPPGKVNVDLDDFDVKLRKNLFYTRFLKYLVLNKCPSNLNELKQDIKNDVMEYILLILGKNSSKLSCSFSCRFRPLEAGEHSCSRRCQIQE
jgi:hypothetical protein